MPLPELKKLKMTVETLHSEKVKLEKQNAKKPASKSKGKITLKADSNVSSYIFVFYSTNQNASVSDCLEYSLGHIKGPITYHHS